MHYIPASGIGSHHINGLVVQDCGNSSAKALELPQSCAKPANYCVGIFGATPCRWWLGARGIPLFWSPLPLIFPLQGSAGLWRVPPRPLMFGWSRLNNRSVVYQFWNFTVVGRQWLGWELPVQRHHMRLARLRLEPALDFKRRASQIHFRET